MCLGMSMYCGDLAADLSDINRKYAKAERFILFSMACKPAGKRRRRCDRRVKRTDDSVNVQVKQTETKGN